MLDMLEDRGELANTYIVFATDNGVHMGQHRYVIPRGSKSTPYEEAASTPLMIRGPGVPRGVVRTQLVANNDFAATFASWAGARASGGWRRQVPGLRFSRRQPPSAWRTGLLNERHLIEPDDSALHPTTKPSSPRRGERYVEYATDEKELYDVRRLIPTSSPTTTIPTRRPSDLASRLRALAGCAGDTCRAAENGQ